METLTTQKLVQPASPHALSAGQSPAPRRLVAYSQDQNFDAHSGYSTLTRYLSDIDSLSVERSPSSRLWNRAIGRALKTYAISNWYQLSSLKLEQAVRTRTRKQPVALTHFLWGERDLGYIDRLLNLTQHPVCCTFHACSDELANILVHSHRLKTLSAIILMSETQRPFFRDCGVDESKIHVVLHGVDTAFFKPLDSYSLEEAAGSAAGPSFTVLCVGSYRRKLSLVRSVALRLSHQSSRHQSNSHQPNIRFKVISSEKNRAYFTDLDNVDFLSRVPASELLRAYQTASCQMLVTENSTANNALLEGLACGLPLVAEKLGGIGEYANSDCAILAAPDDDEALAAAIAQLYSSSTELAYRRNAARERALALDWRIAAARTQAIYDVCCSSLAHPTQNAV